MQETGLIITASLEYSAYSLLHRLAAVDVDTTVVTQLIYMYQTATAIIAIV